MKYLSVSQSEIHEVKKLHESILSKSSHGLFYSMGRIFGKNIIKEIKDPERFFEEAARILKERNFIEDISFEDNTIRAVGSIEAGRADHPTCDILRGIIAGLYQRYRDKKVYCEEIQCASIGVDGCVFEIREEVV